jgi:hypothetical protein
MPTCTSRRLCTYRPRWPGPRMNASFKPSRRPTGKTASMICSSRSRGIAQSSGARLLGQRVVYQRTSDTYRTKLISPACGIAQSDQREAKYLVVCRRPKKTQQSKSGKPLKSPAQTPRQLAWTRSYAASLRRLAETLGKSYGELPKTFAKSSRCCEKPRNRLAPSPSKLASLPCKRPNQQKGRYKLG